MQEQIANEKINVSTLERLLSETRKNKMEHNTSVSELQEEIQGLKANIKCLQETLLVEFLLNLFFTYRRYAIND